MFARYEDSPEQNQVLRQLKDMFASVPYWRLRDICVANNWHLDTCVDQLTNSISDSQERRSHNSSKIMSGKVNCSKEEERVGCLIRKGYRVMILMRGPPGVGKSYLCHSLVKNYVDLENTNYKAEDLICSSDDYFYNAKGEYKYNSVFIGEAHEFNQRRVQEKTRAGLSPIFVDNTNMQLWEMLPYVKFAVQNNYLIEILEPKSPWCDSPSALSQLNKHGVPLKRIKQMKAKYEKGTVDSLMKMLKKTKYSMTLPQMRLQPPLKSLAAPSSSPKGQNSSTNSIPKNQTQNFANNHSAVGNPASPIPKEQRINFKSNRSHSPADDNYSASSKRDVYSLLEKKSTNAWKPFESDSADFWGIKSSNLPDQDADMPSKNVCGEKSLLDLLREDSCNAVNEEQPLSQDYKNESNSPSVFERHSINCVNENANFVTLRQIYPNKRVSGLWDLFVKCKGDIDWAVDILLKEDELKSLQYDGDNIYESRDEEFFECLCNSLDTNNFDNQPEPAPTDANKQFCYESMNSLLHPVNAKPQRQRSRISRFNQLANPALLEVKENIENCFVLGDDLYSEHLLKIRNIRCGTKEASDSSNVVLDNNATLENHVVENDGCEDDEFDAEEDDESDVSQEDMIEVLLGEHLVQQLVDTFKNESSPVEQISSNLPVNSKVFMPRSLAKQLYMLWMEAAFNHLEEQRLKLVKEDEDFARLLKNPKYAECKESPNNVQELLDMEYALKIYNLEKKEQLQDVDNNQIPTDLATHLTNLKLCETFPDIPRETLLDVLKTNNNDYKKTVAVLEGTMQTNDVALTQDLLMECARREEVLVNQEVQTQIEQRQERIYNNWDEYEPKNNMSQEDIKRLALREFEESRNLAAHHCQLKAECYQKAKEAIRSGNGGAAIYYSQIANLHIKKIDMYNHRAANCIIDVHKCTQNNPDLLDLHYLYLIEALGCLDLFLDRHITGLRLASRNYKHVFIITGRGKHSAGGISTIKNKVKARLKERCLRWSEVNPGLLKVKIFSGSRHSKNI